MCEEWSNNMNNVNWIGACNENSSHRTRMRRNWKSWKTDFSYACVIHALSLNKINTHWNLFKIIIHEFWFLIEWVQYLFGFDRRWTSLRINISGTRFASFFFFFYNLSVDELLGCRFHCVFRSKLSFLKFNIFFTP